MPQITVNQPAVIDRLQNDANFRKDFLTNASKTLNSAGYQMTPEILDAALANQLKGRVPGQAASTNTNINIF
jgi:hypothetical protein